MDSFTQTGTILGTAGYLSPEQARGERAGAASDRYALAVVAWELLTGRRPFEARSATEEAAAHVNTPVPSVHAANPSLPRVLRRGVPARAREGPGARATRRRPSSSRRCAARCTRTPGDTAGSSRRADRGDARRRRRASHARRLDPAARPPRCSRAACSRRSSPCAAATRRRRAPPRTVVRTITQPGHDGAADRHDLAAADDRRRRPRRRRPRRQSAQAARR